MHLKPVGFYTQEIREGGVRKGFTLNGLDGSTGLLAHVDFSSDCRVGRYGVDVVGFENFIDRIPFSDPETNLVMIDEIGKMECFSKKFKDLIFDILDTERKFVATVTMKGGGVITKIKKRTDIRLFEVTRKIQDPTIAEILKFVNRH